MKNYFISFEFWGVGYSKHMSCVVGVDLDSEFAIAIARDLIARELGDGYGDAEIKILAFNNIE